jgi:hypothetical protein
MSSSKANPIVLSVNEWNPSSIKYMAPKVNERGGKSIALISKQTNRSLHISTPLLMTWGITDFVDEKTGESDGKYSLSLNFPNQEYATQVTNDFLQKLKDFENQILDDAVKNSEVWWGEEIELAVAKHTFFPFIKYSKNKDTKKIDLSKPPSIRAKVPCYGGRWAVEIYDTNSKLIFPCDNENLTPIDFVPKMSSVACVLQCGGIWIGGKGWGLTWKLTQCVVKPREVVSVYGKCHIQLSAEDRVAIENQEIKEDIEEEEDSDIAISSAPTSTQVKQQTMVEDSDEEDAKPEPEPEPVVVAAPVKKVVKKTTEVVVAPPAAEEPVAASTEAPKKKIIKKKV